MAIERKRELRRRRQRREKVRKLRAHIARTTDKKQKQYLIEKLRRTSVNAPIEVQGK